MKHIKRHLVAYYRAAGIGSKRIEKKVKSDLSALRKFKK